MDERCRRDNFKTFEEINLRTTVDSYPYKNKNLYGQDKEYRPKSHQRRYPYISADKAARHACFERTWKVIKQKLLDYITSEDMPNDAIEWYERNPDYSVFGGKMNRCMSVVGTAKVIKGLTGDEHLKAAVPPYLPFPPFSLVDPQLQAFFLISDDMVDSFITRCWHRVPKVCQITINDSFMLEAVIYYLLKEHFLGRATVLIFWSFSGDDVDMNKLSLTKHSLIVLYKISYYSFYLVTIAVYMSHVPQIHPSGNQAIEPYASLNPSSSPSASIIIQDDFLD
ncbi:hypothetical protein EDD85DRAFT_1027673 [Armillaria nabsnona]|nr:hypothetical protein EDD85DRAFT_1027673 [Armillaria nabsnona]